MKKNWFKDEILNWSASIKWSKNEMEEVSNLLLEISKFNRGEIVWDCPQDARIEKDYAVQQAMEAIQSRMSYYSKIFVRNNFNYFPKEKDKIKTSLSFVIPREFHPMVNLNFLNPRELEKLPGIGKTTALRILKKAKELGGFNKVDDLLKIKGISKKNLDRIKEMLFISLEAPSNEITNQDLVIFLNQPTFKNYVNLLEKGICVGPEQSKLNYLGENPKTMIALELSDILVHQKTDKTAKRNCIKTRGSKVIRRKKEREEAINLIKSYSMGEGIGGVLSGSIYPHFLLSLLSNAKLKIRIVMFFFVFEKNKKSPTSPLVEEIIKAKNSGIDVKVILDKDEEGDVYGSRVANKKIYDYLKENKVQVKFETQQRRIHSKVVLVDDNHVVVGSHNWTGGSFYQYDDISIYAESKELSSFYHKMFDEMWRMI